jgi:hypothetical protein
MISSQDIANNVQAAHDELISKIDIISDDEFERIMRDIERGFLSQII